jgi:protein-glutamine gamma-glutamyltransferase
MYLDSLSYFWNLTVINYDLERQLSLFNRANTRLRQMSLPGAFTLRGALRAVAPLLIMAILWRMRAWRRPGREERLLKALFAVVRRRYGIQWPPDKGLHELAATIGDPRLKEFANLYGGVVYRDRKLSRDEYQKLSSLLAELRATPHKP